MCCCNCDQKFERAQREIRYLRRVVDALATRTSGAASLITDPDCQQAASLRGKAIGFRLAVDQIDRTARVLDRLASSSKTRALQ